MLVRDHMSRRIVGVAPHDTVQRAQEIMREHGVRHLPVLRGSRLAGILSDRDLRGARQSTKWVQDLMTLNPISISPDAAVDEAAGMMDARKVSSLPVVESGRVIGILTTTDVLRAFVALSGAVEPTTRVIIAARHGRGIESQVRHIVHACHGELKWIHQQGRNLHLRLKARHVDDIVHALEGAGLNVTAVVSSQEARAATRRGTSAARRVVRRRAVHSP